MEEIKALLETQPLFSLFLTIALGYLVGEISIKGFSLGSGAVLFVGLAIGGFARVRLISVAIGPVRYSWRSASIGSICAARRAGK